MHKVSLRSRAIALAGALLMLVPATVTAANIVEYSYPASWDGVAAVVTDLSPAGNNGSVAGTPTLSPMIPAGMDPATQSLATLDGGHRTDATSLLDNATLEASGGFVFETYFYWDGGSAGFSAQKIIDYAGTEFLQLEGAFPANTAQLRFGFNDDVIGPATMVDANTWYHVVATFDTMGNSVVGGQIDGLASLVVNGAPPITENLTKSAFGDGLGRPIGFGTFAGSSGGIVNLSGLVYDPTVALLPEPTSLALLALGGLALLRRR
jgi:hypothetical protein